MKIAVASSGLGHVARGIETWAIDAAQALSSQSVDVALFAGGARVPQVECPLDIVSCLQRDGRAARFLSRWTPPFLWRLGLTSTYGWEQFSFWLALWPKLLSGKFDILHVQDPLVATWCRRFRKLRLVRAKEILAHGTEEPVSFLAHFDYVQHLAPWHERTSARALEGTRDAAKPWWTSIPNFVDTGTFRPAANGAEKLACRRRFGLPETAFIVGAVAAVKRRHKRIDYLINEFAAYVDGPVGRSMGAAPHLVIAGAATDQTEVLRKLAQLLKPERIRILTDLPRSDMPALLRCFDVFALASLFEMMPIAVLEALATGLPLVTHHHPVLQWMVGDPGNAECGMQHAECEVDDGMCGGMCVDLSQEGGLAEVLAGLTPRWLTERGQGARRRAESMFSKRAVIGQYIDYYTRILE